MEEQATAAASVAKEEIVEAVAQQAEVTPMPPTFTGEAQVVSIEGQPHPAGAPMAQMQEIPGMPMGAQQMAAMQAAGMQMPPGMQAYAAAGMPMPVAGGDEAATAAGDAAAGMAQMAGMQSMGGEEDDDDEEDAPDGPPKKKRGGHGRRKIEIEYIEDKIRRHITFSKRKAGISKKAYELSRLTGAQVLLLISSERGQIYSFATPKLQPILVNESSKALIEQCLNAPDPMAQMAIGGPPMPPQQPDMQPVMSAPLAPHMQVPPGMAPPGMVPPGMAPPGMAPPGMAPGMLPPGQMRDAQIAGAMVAMQPGMTHDANGQPMMIPPHGYMVAPDGSVMPAPVPQ